MHPVSCFVFALVTFATVSPKAFSQSPGTTERYTVAEQEIDDLKAVFATVRSRDLTNARVRTPGTITSLKIDEGDEVKAGQVLALVVDPKIALRIKALDAQIVALESRVATAETEYGRAVRLRQRGITPQARVDQLKTALDVVVNDLKAARSQRMVADQQVAEGRILAPAEGRVLKVSVTAGSVVLPGESVATIAANDYLLRLSLPERHARFIKPGDVITIGARGLSPGQAVVAEGRITQIYPELQAGRVIADATASGLGVYFVGERALVWISAGRRRTIIVPKQYIFTRFGQDFTRLVRTNGSTLDIVVQLGHPRPPASGMEEGREILAGLKPGDVITPAPVKP